MPDGDENELRPRRRLSQSEARQETRRQLLAAAAQLFARKGFAGASIEEISELAGYTTGALYYHFPNKDQLFLELIRSGWSRMNANWVAALTKAFEDDSVDTFAAIDRMVVERSERSNEQSPLEGEIWLYALRNVEGMEVVRGGLREQAEGLEPVVAALMEQGQAAPGIAPDEMTTVALALFQGLVRRRRIDPGSVPDDLLARVLRRLFAPEAQT